MASVASFFISRIDSLVDSTSNRTGSNRPTMPASRHCSKSLLGKVAIANGKLTYQRYQEFSAGRAGKLLPPKARRPSACCGPAPAPRIQLPRRYLRRRTDRPDTVNTIPPATFDAFRDHGNCATASPKIVEARKR